MKLLKPLFLIVLFLAVSQPSAGREKYNFNHQWLLQRGDVTGGEAAGLDDSDWERVTIPRAHNEDEAFKVPIAELSDTVVWYRKHFTMPRSAKGQKVFVEFEGVRMGADFYLNGHHLGWHENGVMAVGFDLTPYIKYNGDNVLAVRVDNDWEYRERATGQRYQWNDKNFNANYGGIPKNVWLHVAPTVYQTLPLYSNLGTTGTYVYATDIDVAGREAVINAESQVRNESGKNARVEFRVAVTDPDGKRIAEFGSPAVTVAPGDTVTLKASDKVGNLHFWSWGYGYLYDVTTSLVVNGKVTDDVSTRTGFRKTKFADGKIWLNDRVIQMKGYAQRTSNEWPGVGMSVPAWMSDYSNGMVVEGNGNLVRWMHVAPWRQDVESCDRVGLMQMMPAGDAEKDVDDRRWGQRTELMRDAIIYYRNNPSVIFYESGNKAVSHEHLMEMKAIRDKYDPHGGRALGSREMLDDRSSEYGGEMLYVNKSEHHPMVQTEYCRDEGLRKYWDDWSYPYHKHGAGPLYRGADASAYNQNQDQLALEMVRRWNDLYRERAGGGRRVNSGGVKIIFSDTQTHCRGEENYRRSGVTDAMRIPKDAFFAHKVMWDGWVDTEGQSSHIIGHWNYEPGTVKPVYVVSTADDVELLLNGRSLGHGEKSDGFTFTFPSVAWEAGTLEAVGRDSNGAIVSRATVKTAGAPAGLKMTLIQGPEGTWADGADLAMVQVEVVDKDGQRCPLANDMIDFTLDGPAEWRGGIAQGDGNMAFSRSLPVECGVTRVLVRSSDKAGNVSLTANAGKLGKETVSFKTLPVEVKNGLSTHIPASYLPLRLERGETPLGSTSYAERKRDVRAVGAKAGSGENKIHLSYDDNEASEWASDGRIENAWITYELEREAEIDDLCIKLSGWRTRSYPLEVLAGDELVWSGDTDRSLGYIHLNLKPVKSRFITLRLKGAAAERDEFGQITELAEKDSAASVSKKKNQNLRIVEIEFLESVKNK